MCDTQITPQVQTIDKLPLGARIFIVGKNRPLHVTQTPEDVAGQINDASVGVVLVHNLNAEVTVIPKERIVSVVAPTPSERRKVNVPAPILWGKKYTFRGLSAFNSSVDPEYAVRVPEGDDEHNYVAVVAEDMADALLLVVNVETGQILWTNPAEPERSIRRLVKAARLVAEAEALMLLENAVHHADERARHMPEGTPDTTGDPQ